MKKFLSILLITSLVAQPIIAAEMIKTSASTAMSALTAYPKTMLAGSCAFAVYRIVQFIRQFNHTNEILKAFKKDVFENITYSSFDGSAITCATFPDAINNLYLLSEKDKKELDALISAHRQDVAHQDAKKKLHNFIDAQLKSIDRIPRSILASLGLTGISIAQLLPQLISLAPWVTACLPLLSSPLGTKKPAMQPASKAIQDLIDSMAKERGFKTRIVANIVPRENNHDFSCNEFFAILNIPSDKATELTSALSQHIDNPTQNPLFCLHKGSIHHELTHIERQSQQRINKAQNILGLLAVGCMLLLSIGEERSILANLFLAGTIYLFSQLFNKTMARHEESRCDEGIPNDRALLQAQADDYQKMQRELDAVIQSGTKVTSQDSFGRFLINKGIAKRCSKMPGFNKILTINNEHPDYQSRAQRFKDRIAELDKKK